MRLEGKKCIITGATRGIGKGIAAKFLLEGAQVYICGTEEHLVTQTVKELSAIGPIHGCVADVSNAHELSQFVNEALLKLGTVDVLVNNAGIAKFEPFLEISEQSWNRTLAVNLTGAFLCSQIVAKEMVKRGKGCILHNSSTNGVLGEAGLAHYNASKAALILLSKTMAIELAPYNIRVNAVCPGFIQTDLALEGGMNEAEIAPYLEKIPLHRRGSITEVANAFAFLASDEASFITGTELVVDGGQICHE